MPPVAIDILLEIPGITFNTAWRNRITHIIDDDSGLTAHFISRDDLIAAKLASGRARDLADVEELRNAEAHAAAEVIRSVKPRTPRARATRNRKRLRPRP